MTALDELAEAIRPNTEDSLFKAFWAPCGGIVCGHKHPAFLRRSRAGVALLLPEAVALDGWVLHLSKDDKGIWTALIGFYDGQADNWLDALAAAELAAWEAKERA